VERRDPPKALYSKKRSLGFGVVLLRRMFRLFNADVYSQKQLFKSARPIGIEIQMSQKRALLRADLSKAILS
jgi:hypothetical protein